MQRWCTRRSDLCVMGGGGADAEGLGPDDGGHRAQPGGHGPIAITANYMQSVLSRQQAILDAITLRTTG